MPPQWPPLVPPAQVRAAARLHWVEPLQVVQLTGRIHQAVFSVVTNLHRLLPLPEQGPQRLVQQQLVSGQALPAGRALLQVAGLQRLEQQVAVQPQAGVRQQAHSQVPVLQTGRSPD